ncbi:MAG TPA: peptide-methionine (S)-S-oxide reductase MsrA [Puia sp.]|jgi:peptide-methionine (S)-S-oxide reductase|nr:peptide-methionine (S)-S-oxide reductase MsrA [Puia sp.]
MKRLFFTFCAIFFVVACGQTQTVIPTKDPGPASPHEQAAYFAEGCFWHAEIVFQSLLGVRDAVSGFSGGSAPSPSYEDVCTGSTGHAETVKVLYDPTKISFKTLVEAFFASVDPTQLNRQGNDVGTQYRSIIFYRNAEEKKIIDDEIAMLTASHKFSGKIVTEVRPFTNFYPAEDYHQEYIRNHPSNGYVQMVSIPDYIEFRKTFKGPFKPNL